MGGGLGAKERRRLKRLAESNEAGKAQQEAPTTTRHNARAREDKISRQHSSKQTSVKNGERKALKRKQPSPKKPKVQKPKHLKRKLEAAGDENPDEKERILQELQDFEEKKEKLSKRRKQDRKRKRPGKAEILDKDPPPPDQNAGARLRQPFVRSVPKPAIGENVASKSLFGISEQKPVKVERVVDRMEEKSAEKESRQQVAGNDSDEELGDVGEPKRTRGKRRRGRKDTSKYVEETKKEEEEEIQKEIPPEKTPEEPIAASATKKENLENGEKSKRYCIGRKPVTDFKVGESYKGRVVYVKPFGVFMDIGCHSDAFCHVSRLSDEFVESPETVFQPGDEVEARVVEINRRQKRITVSLQSEARIEDERLSIEARQKRLEVRGKKSKGLARSASHTTTPIEKDVPELVDDKQDKLTAIPEVMNALDESETGKEDAEINLKRARKLARRAARRAAAEASVDNAKQ